MVEMTAAAITARLERFSRLFDPSRSAVDMSAAAIGARLRELSALSRFCEQLGRIGTARLSRERKGT